MIEFWMSLWTFIWFAGLAVFAVLSVLVILLGGFDLAALLSSLRRRHYEALAAKEEPWAPELPPPPPAP